MTILSEITAYKREEVAAAKERLPLAELETIARDAPKVRPFAQALDDTRETGCVALIAEIKKASPSKGLIRENFDPAELARDYELGGAACLSVLTDTPSFQGSPEHLAAARDAVRLPVLRKDFILDPYQIVESRALWADCILIIVAMHDKKTVRDLCKTARDWGMDALIEVHNEPELDIALAADTDLIGINNRDLNTFVTDIGVTLKLAPKIPPGRHIIAESGLSSPFELKRLAKVGVTAYLIGESLMRAANVERATRDLIVGAA